MLLHYKKHGVNKNKSRYPIGSGAGKHGTVVVKSGKSVLLLLYFLLKMSESVILVGTIQTKP